MDGAREVDGEQAYFLRLTEALLLGQSFRVESMTRP